MAEIMNKLQDCLELLKEELKYFHRVMWCFIAIVLFTCALWGYIAIIALPQIVFTAVTRAFEDKVLLVTP